MILVDTSVWVDFLRGENSPERWTLHHLIENDDQISITEIILTEVLQGIRNDKEFQIIQNYLLEFPIYKPRSIETYLNAARIYRDCRKRSKTVRKTVDCVIAAICLENGIAILHKDSDFDAIATGTELQVLTPLGN